MDADKLDLSKPHLMTSFTDKWPCRSWTFRSLAALLGDQQFNCRVAPKSCVQTMETQCSHHDVTIEQFCDWLEGITDGRNPLHNFTREENFCYVDYKYMKDMFKDHADVFKDVQWCDFGLIDFDGYDSTIWLSSEGANTAGHQDTYGFNLISQICGKKVWILFPPEDSKYLYPTRVPYEESSIFTGVNIRRPDPQLHPKFWFSHPVVVTLSAGQTLYVPRHWWHYVESLEPSISINVWVPVKDDIESHLSEAITRCLATSLITSLDTSEDKLQLSTWLNPTESLSPTTTNLFLLKAAMCQLLEDCHVHESSNINVENQDAHVLLQHGDQPNYQETEQSNNSKLKSGQSVYSSNGRTDEFLFHQSLLNLFGEKLKGFEVINVDTPFQFDAKLAIKTSAGVLQEPSPKKSKLEPTSVDGPLQTSSDFPDDKFMKETFHPRIFSFVSCLFESYLKFLDILCRQIKCRQCHAGSSVDVNIKPNTRRRIVSKAHRATGNSIVNVPASGNQQEENSKSEHGSFTAFSENICIPKLQTIADDTCKKKANVLDFHREQSEQNDGSKIEDKDLIDKSEADSSKMEENLKISSGTDEDSSNSCSSYHGPFSELSQQEVSETLLSCVLHPDVVKVISELFKEELMGRWERKVRLQ